MHFIWFFIPLLDVNFSLTYKMLEFPNSKWEFPAFVRHLPVKSLPLGVFHTCHHLVAENSSQMSFIPEPHFPNCLLFLLCWLEMWLPEKLSWPLFCLVQPEAVYSFCVNSSGIWREKPLQFKLSALTWGFLSVMSSGEFLIQVFLHRFSVEIISRNG